MVPALRTSRIRRCQQLVVEQTAAHEPHLKMPRTVVWRRSRMSEPAHMTTRRTTPQTVVHVVYPSVLIAVAPATCDARVVAR
jgi:hypothetical protein